jgi:phage terminase small subunit
MNDKYYDEVVENNGVLNAESEEVCFGENVGNEVYEMQNTGEHCSPLQGNIDISEKEKRFCENYINCNNIYQAAVDAGYEESYAKARSYTFLQKPHIKAYLASLSKIITDDKIMSAREVLELWSNIARGTLQNPNALPKNLYNAIDKKYNADQMTFDQLVTEDKGYFIPDEVKIPLGARLKASELIAKNLEMLTEKQNINISINEDLASLTDEELKEYLKKVVK